MAHDGLRVRRRGRRPTARRSGPPAARRSALCWPQRVTPHLQRAVAGRHLVPARRAGAFIQPAINQAGWASGNALTLVVRGAGQNWARKFATAFEGGAALAPATDRHLLVVAGRPARALSIGDVTVAEGNSGTTSATFSRRACRRRARRSSPPPGPRPTAAPPPAATIRRPTGRSRSRPIRRRRRRSRSQVSGDTTVGAQRDLRGQSDRSPTNATIADGQGTGTITNDDAASSLAIGRGAVAEGQAARGAGELRGDADAGQQPGRSPSATPRSTARPPRAATTPPTSGTLIFAAGETPKTVSVRSPATPPSQRDADRHAERTDQRDARHRQRPGHHHQRRHADAPPLDRRRDPRRGQCRHHALHLHGDPLAGQRGAVTVTYATANGTATAGSDYTAVPPTVLTIPAGTAVDHPVTVTVTGDTAGEANETFVVNLSAPVNATIADGRAPGRSPMTRPDRSPSPSRSRSPPAPTTSTR